MPATTITPSRSSQTVLVLGARGRFGRAAVAAFSQAGWQVRAFVRSGRQPERAFRGETINGDAFDPGDVVAAANGANVIVHALNPPYPRWRRDLPRLTKSVLAAAHASGATVMIPGNVYNYGAGMPETLLEETPHRPTTRKGALRESMEATFRDAANRRGKDHRSSRRRLHRSEKDRQLVRHLYRRKTRFWHRYVSRAAR